MSPHKNQKSQHVNSAITFSSCSLQTTKVMGGPARCNQQSAIGNQHHLKPRYLPPFLSKRQDRDYMSTTWRWPTEIHTVHKTTTTMMKKKKKMMMMHSASQE